jgi:hypothetical protein
MKICTKCKTDYPTPLEDHFNKRAGSKDGLQHRCKKCIAVLHKEHYELRTDYYLAKAKKRNYKIRVSNLQFMIDYLKENPCIDCGETDPIVLEFDHRSDKTYNVSEMRTLSLETIKQEIQKCDVRCANCHKKKTAKQFNYYKGIRL